MKKSEIRVHVGFPLATHAVVTRMADEVGLTLSSFLRTEMTKLANAWLEKQETEAELQKFFPGGLK